MMEPVFLFDFDGTITKTEMLPLLAKNLTSASEILELTEKTVRGLVPFEESFLKRIELLREIPTPTIQKIFTEAPVNTKLLSWIKEHRELCYVVTGQLDIWMKPWFLKHKLNGFSSEATIENNVVGVSKVIDKSSIADHFPGREIIMVGDGANDATLMEKASTSIGTEIVHKVPEMIWELADIVIWEEDSLCRTLSRLL
jgi:phosphoserine phosphatase